MVAALVLRFGDFFYFHSDVVGMSETASSEIASCGDERLLGSGRNNQVC